MTKEELIERLDAGEDPIKAFSEFIETEIIKCVDDEPEFPGDMPDELWEILPALIESGRENTANYLRHIVKETKDNIKERISAIKAELEK